MDETVTAVLDRGFRLLEEGAFEASVEAFRSALSLDTSVTKAHRGLARALEALGLLDEALASIGEALSLSPADPGSWMTRGSIHARRAERMSALDCFHRLVQLEPRRAAGHHLLRSAGGKGFSAPLWTEVSELFDQVAGRFDRHLLDGLGYCGHRVLPDLVKRISATDRAEWVVLELGCGTGLCGPELRPLARRLLGVDLSPGILELARARNVYDALWVADLVYALACAAERSADLVLAADVFSYLGDLTPVFEESARVLAPSGRLAFTVETCEADEKVLVKSSRRVAFSRSVIEDLSRRWCLAIEWLEPQVLRQERGLDVVELVCVLRQPER